MPDKKLTYYDYDPPCLVIGPQIGPSFTPCAVRITIAFPHLIALDTVICILKPDASGSDRSEATNVDNSIFRNFVFAFSDLVPGRKYFYSFHDKAGNMINLGPGLDVEDCHFYGPSFSDANDRFVLASCNNPFYSGLPPDKQFNMWERLLVQITKDKNIKLFVQGGDQLYNDAIEEDSIALLLQNPMNVDAVRKKMIRNYQHYYGNPAIRKVLACIPSVAMWDDHDITDGWGGRPESFDANGDFKPEWKAYFDIAREAFRAYQTPKNPELRLYSRADTALLDFGQNRLVLLDLRTEKNVKNQTTPLVSQEHEDAIHRAITELPAEALNCFVLSPVVPVRINPLEEAALELSADALYAERKHLASDINPSWWKKMLVSLTNAGGVADLGDDLTDGLSAPTNISFLKRLIQTLVKVQGRLQVNTVILTGDIHTGGISEIFAYGDDNKPYSIPQIVSSPIGYEPMGSTVQTKTTEMKDFVIEASQGKTGGIVARNIFYRSDRNFAVITPGRIGEADGVQFFFEGLARPISSAAYFSDLRPFEALKVSSFNKDGAAAG